MNIFSNKSPVEVRNCTSLHLQGCPRGRQCPSHAIGMCKNSSNKICTQCLANVLNALHVFSHKSFHEMCCLEYKNFIKSLVLNMNFREFVLITKFVLQVLSWIQSVSRNALSWTQSVVLKSCLDCKSFSKSLVPSTNVPTKFGWQHENQKKQPWKWREVQFHTYTIPAHSALDLVGKLWSLISMYISK